MACVHLVVRRDGPRIRASATSFSTGTCLVRRAGRTSAVMRRRSLLALSSIVLACSPNRAPTSTGDLPQPTSTASPPGATISSTIPDPGSHESAIDPELTAPIAQINSEEGVGLVEGAQGQIGAWMALGPFRLPEKSGTASVVTFRPPADAKGTTLDDHAFAPVYGGTLAAHVDVPIREVGKDGKAKDKIKSWTSQRATWTLASSGEGPIDLERQFGSGGKPAVGYLASVLRLPVSMKLLLLIGADDGLEVLVDGSSRFVRDASRTQRDDDDFVPLELAAGDHTFVLKLHQHDGGWAVHARLVDAAAMRPPLGARWLLPKAPSSVGSELARSMSWVKIARTPTENGYRLGALVRFPEGAPIDVALPVSASMLAEGGAIRVDDHSLGAIEIGRRAPSELTATISELFVKKTPAVEVPSGSIDFTDDERAARDFTVRVDVAGRHLEGAFHPREPVRSAIARARAVVAKWATASRPAAIPDDVQATLEYLSDRLASQVAHGDGDAQSELADAAFLAAFADDADAGRDPLATRTGAMRLAHYAKADGKPQPFALYVPNGLDALKPGKKLPLYVGLHGMNGGPMSMLRIFFGGDDEGKSMADLDRRFEGVQTTKLTGFVLAPHAHGNAMYRQLGEEEVMDLVSWTRARFPQVDDDRVYMTGFSMGGIGAASIPLHHPDVFAAAAPLCGYHSYAIRRDIQGRARRPWESFLIDERSNVEWAPNGARLPLWIVHGTHDLPEENSGVLIDAYERFGFSIKHDHPDKGHDVWGYAYDHLAQVGYFLGHRRDPHPKHVRFRTTRPRFGDDAWVHVDALVGSAAWGVIDAKVASKKELHLKTDGIAAVHFDRDPELLGGGEISVHVDGKKLVFAEGAELALHRVGESWLVGPMPTDDGLRKVGKLTGPIRDVWNEPLTIVYGASDPAQTNANLEVAQWLAAVRWGVDVSYPIVRDDEIDPLSTPTRATILIGNARSNRLTHALEAELPMQVIAPGTTAYPDGAIVFAGKTFTGEQLGAVFVVPHPKAHDRYLLVVEGVDALGTLRALSLPELLPDFVIWDSRMAPSRGQQILSFGAVLSAGFFDASWKPPAKLDDPLLEKLAPSAKNEKDSTSYLP